MLSMSQVCSSTHGRSPLPSSSALCIFVDIRLWKRSEWIVYSNHIKCDSDLDSVLILWVTLSCFWVLLQVSDLLCGLCRSVPYLCKPEYTQYTHILTHTHKSDEYLNTCNEYILPLHAGNFLVVLFNLENRATASVFGFFMSPNTKLQELNRFISLCSLTTWWCCWLTLWINAHV